MPPNPRVAPPRGAPNAPALSEAIRRAVDALARGDLAEAERNCRRALETNSDSFEALYLLAIVAGQGGRAQDAVSLLERALRARPNDPYAHFNRGVALGQLGRFEEAVASYDRVVALKPDHADAHFNRGVALESLGHLAEALRSYERAVAADPGHVEAHNNRGVVLARLQRPQEALECYARAIALRPDYAVGHNNRGNALRDLHRHAEAAESYRRAIAIRPDYAEAHNNLGVVLFELERPAESLASCERALALRPEYADAHYNAGNALRQLTRCAEAAERFERALSLQPDHAAAHWNLADCYLMLGDFARGWREYEWRWKLEDRLVAERGFAAPLWLGSPAVTGRTVLLHGERGLGDTLHFCRYAKLVADLGATVVLEVQPPLVSLLASLEGVSTTVPTGAPLPPFDFHCPLMGLPLAFRTDERTIPAEVPYIRSDAARTAAWQDRLGARRKPRVGLVWSGSAALSNDKRSMTLDDLAPMLGDRVEWVSLQKEVRAADAAFLESRPEIRAFGTDLRDFVDTAALIELMDLVVSIDTSVAHLAGAMGKPVWIMLPFVPVDWRWQLDREDSAWYPTARLFRQPAVDDWKSVVSRAGEALGKEFLERR